MHFVVSEDCVRLGLRAAAVVFRGLRVGPAGPELRAESVEEARRVQGAFATPAAIRAAVEALGFPDVLRRVGVNPRREQPSVERLLAFALKRGDLPAVNSLVDAYNLVSVRSRCSLGAHDLDRIECPVALRLLTGGEAFTPLGVSEPVPVRAGEYGYVDAAGRVLCRLDLLQAEFSKVTHATANALLIVEGTATHDPQTLRGAVAAAAGAVTRHCGGTAEVVALPG
jgi:DNA/RNA-binding domain of Phe-tRNA-synthetase-like protein